MSEQKITFFDLDHTLLKGNCSFDFGLYLIKEKEIALSQYFFLIWYYSIHKLGLIDIYSLHEASFRFLLKGKQRDFFSQLGRNFVTVYFDRLLNEKIFQILRTKLQKGEKVVILSSSPDFLVGAFAEKMGVTDWKSTNYQTNSKGEYQALNLVLEGKEKAMIVKKMEQNKGGSFELTSGYSDSYHDLLFLESVAVPIAVNPDKKLNKICLERGWDVLLT